MEQPGGASSRLDRIEQWARIIGAVIVPVVVSYAGYRVTRAGTDATYVQVAASVLTSKDTDPQLRDWALRVMDAQGRVAFEPKLANLLKDGTIVFPKITLSASGVSIAVGSGTATPTVTGPAATIAPNPAKP